MLKPFLDLLISCVPCVFGQKAVWIPCARNLFPYRVRIISVGILPVFPCYLRVLTVEMGTQKGRRFCLNQRP